MVFYLHFCLLFSVLFAVSKILIFFILEKKRQECLFQIIRKDICQNKLFLWAKTRFVSFNVCQNWWLFFPCLTYWLINWTTLFELALLIFCEKLTNFLHRFSSQSWRVTGWAPEFLNTRFYGIPTIFQNHSCYLACVLLPGIHHFRKSHELAIKFNDYVY